MDTSYLIITCGLFYMLIVLPCFIALWAHKKLGKIASFVLLLVFFASLPLWYTNLWATKGDMSGRLIAFNALICPAIPFAFLFIVGWFCSGWSRRRRTGFRR